ncbi:hypothetical protein RRF57_010180 [Xylaria bambusicola]|uniref:Uncharacterized protein n=1 Tax=Xylaria bambusicola TaxID=326684 RepID=A0AAN7US22_9PEZI
MQMDLGTDQSLIDQPRDPQLDRSLLVLLAVRFAAHDPEYDAHHDAHVDRLVAAHHHRFQNDLLVLEKQLVKSYGLDYPLDCAGYRLAMKTELVSLWRNDRQLVQH